MWGEGFEPSNPLRDWIPHMKCAIKHVSLSGKCQFPNIIAVMAQHSNTLSPADLTTFLPPQDIGKYIKKTMICL
jgi:hypothetical protein